MHVENSSKSQLESLRHSAKEILAAAVCELFPGTRLIQGGVDEIGFSYEFLFQKNIISLFSEKELFQIEDRMRLIIYEKRKIEHKEMMRENAALFLDHLKQELRADVVEESAENIVSIFKMGEFHDLSPPPYLSNSHELKAFQLLNFSLIQMEDESAVRIYGTAFPEKGGLKEFLKRYKTGLKKSFSVRGPSENYVLPLDMEDSMGIILPKGEEIYHKLVDYWRNAHLQQGFSLLLCPSDTEPKKEHALAQQKLNVSKTASLNFENGDFATIGCHKKEVLAELISSLHFIERTFKIFGLEMRISLTSSNAKENILKSALDDAKLDYQIEETKIPGTVIEFYSFDSLGRESLLSCLALDSDKVGVIYRSLFCSLQKWLTLYIEREKEY